MSLVGAQLEMGPMTGSCPCLIGRHSGSLFFGILGISVTLRLGSRSSQVGGASLSRSMSCFRQSGEGRHVNSPLVFHVKTHKFNMK